MDQSDNEEFDPDLTVVVFELSKTSEAAKAKDGQEGPAYLVRRKIMTSSIRINPSRN
jgi:hypothetical protein